MTDNICWIIEADVHDGKQAELRSLAADFTEGTKNEAGAVGYEWSLSADGKRIHIYERYADSDAALVHLGNVGGRLPELFALCSITSIACYGSASDVFRSATAGMPFEFHETFAGFHR